MRRNEHQHDDDAFYDDGAASSDYPAGESASYEAWSGDVGDESSYGAAFSEDEASRALLANPPASANGHLVPMGEATITAPTLIPGSGVSMGNPFIKRRERPLTMRLAVFTLMTCILITGLFSVTALGESGTGGAFSPFQALAGSVMVHQGVSYTWYVAQNGDDLGSVAQKFHVQVGGIMELNNLSVGQELQTGKPYKIPNDPYYGANYQPSNPYPTSGNGSTTFGTDFWNAYGGAPLPEQPCGPNGGSNPLGYDLQSPNWGSHWVRGFTWYHNGDDIAAAEGNPIRAAQAGVVIWAGWSNGGFGYSAVIYHCNYLSTLYGHMAVVSVKEGQFVQAGQIIGLEGSTGMSTGPHLHYGVMVHNQFVDPMLYYTSIAALTHT